MTILQHPHSDTIMDIALSQLITLEAAGFRDGAYPIREIDKEHVSHLMEIEPDSWVPIETVLTDKGYAVIDGYHRWAAKAALKASTIRGYVRNYIDENAVIDAAFQANLKHGLPASTATRIDYAIWLMNNLSLSQRQAAKKAGISHVTVGRAIKKLQQADSDDTDQGRYNTSMIDYTKRLITSLVKFYDHESAIFGSASGTRSESKRAKALAAKVAKDVDQATAKEIASMFQSLAKSLNEAANIIAPTKPKAG